MKTVVLGLVVVAVIVLAIGLASGGPRVDIDYIIGTWHQASLTAVAAIVAGLVLVCGLGAAIVALLGQAADRRALEAELQRTYVRLRSAEGESTTTAASASGVLDASTPPNAGSPESPLPLSPSPPSALAAPVTAPAVEETVGPRDAAAQRAADEGDAPAQRAADEGDAPAQRAADERPSGQPAAGGDDDS